MDPEVTPDLVGRTSARLAALGVSRADRLEALHLLAILDASADAEGVVRRPLDDLADEFELHPAGVFRALDHLSLAGAVERDGAFLRFVDRDEGGVGGLRLAEFLDDVRSTRAAREDRIGRLQVRAVAAALAAAAAVAVLTLAPSTSVPPAPVAIGRDATTAMDPASTSEPSEQARATTRTETRLVEPETVERGTPFEPPILTTLAAAACPPEGGPIVSIVDGVVYVANTARADLRVLQLTIAGSAVAIDLIVPTGETVAAHQLLALDDVAVGEWEWVDPELERGCAS